MSRRLPLALLVVLAIASSASAARTVDYRWYSFFDAPLVEDAWTQREEVGFVKVRSFTHPVTHEATYVDGPALVPGMKATNDLYAPARLAVTARELPEITIDTIGGTRSPAATPMGFVPYDLMGGLGAPPSGGTLRVQAYMQFIDRERANELRIPQQFGYHGWENEAVVTYTMDRAAARKVLGISDADVTGIASWFAAHEADFEQAWWWWLNDEGGDVHVGGAGRLDVRFAFNTPMQTWRVDFLSATYVPGTDSVVLELDWVAMASDILWSRWLKEALGTNFESSALSDLTLDVTIGPTSTDLDLDAVVDYALTLTGSTWVFEPTSADVPNLAIEYLNESLYQSPGLAYADKGYNGNPKVGFDYVPAAWNLRAGETLTIDVGDVAAKGQMTLAFAKLEPRAIEFPGQIDAGPTQVTYTGPIDFGAWSRTYQPNSWLKLADSTHPDGLLPWGEPYVSLRARAVDPAAIALFKKPKKPARVGKKDADRTIPPFPSPVLEPTPPLDPGPGGRTLKVDLYDFLDVPMVADRWDQYDHNDYVRVNSLTFPVSYQTTPYFSDEEPEPFSEKASGVRMKVTGRSLPEITIDTIGGGANPAGFLPHDLMGELEGGVTGGTAQLRGHLVYGTRTRESVYRMPDYWGYYGWENFFDARIVLDRAAAKKVLGITDAQFTGFAPWFAANEQKVETAWRLWLYEEWKRVQAMPWFNYPIQIWALDIRRVSSSGGQVVLDLTVLNEALDVVFGRWFTETFLPHSESSYDDMHMLMTIGPSGTDVDLDMVCDFAVGGDQVAPGVTAWSWEPFFGDNPFLAHEYRAFSSPALPYFGKFFHEGEPDEFPYTSVPRLWHLGAGEQLNFHFGSSGLTLDHLEPGPADFPTNIVVDPAHSASLTGPLDLTAWSMGAYPDEWAATGGLVPTGAPAIVLTDG